MSLRTFGLDSNFLKRENKFDHHGGVIINFQLVYKHFFLNYVRDFWLVFHQDVILKVIAFQHYLVVGKTMCCDNGMKCWNSK
jgi:hypothetical protein